MDTILNIKSGQDINLSLNQIEIEIENKNSISFSIIMCGLFLKLGIWIKKLNASAVVLVKLFF